MSKYVHGYSARESCRLQDQANTLIDLLHHDTVYPAGDRVLEAGCGVGAQTVILAKNNPHAQIFSVDISRKSAEMARMRVFQEGFSNVRFGAGDLFCLPFKEETFDHVFVCFVLEHLGNPLAALEQLKKMIRKGGTITVIEGDHGSYYCHPETAEANLAVQCLIDVQARMKGNSLIGRQVYPLLTAAGFHEVNVSPRMVYVDASRPELVDGFTRKTFIAMVEGVRDQALAMNLIDEKTWEKGISDLYRTTRADGTFCYTFFKGVGVKK